MRVIQNVYFKAALVLLIVVGIIFAISNSITVKARIKENHKVVCGTVVWKNVGGRQCYIKCNFIVEGVQYEKDFSCTSKTHKASLNGFDYVLIVYDSTSPKFSHLLETSDDFMDYGITHDDTLGIVCNTVYFPQNY